MPLMDSRIFEPLRQLVAVLRKSARKLTSDIGHRIASSEENGVHLFQCVSIIVQRFNNVLLHFEDLNL